MTKENKQIKNIKNKEAKKTTYSTITIVIIVLIILFAIFICTKLIFNNLNKSKSGAYSIFNENGEKINTSKKLIKDKTISDIKLDNISVKSIENITTITSKVTNLSNNTKENLQIEFNLIDKNGNTIQTVIGFIQNIAQNETQDLNISIEGDYVDIYDFYIRLL